MSRVCRAGHGQPCRPGSAARPRIKSEGLLAERPRIPGVPVALHPAPHAADHVLADRVRRALAAVFAGPVGKDVVSRVWRRVKGDWDAWNARPLGEEAIVRLILDGTVVRVRLDKRATSISLLVALGVRADGQKVLLAIRRHGQRKRGRLARAAR